MNRPQFRNPPPPRTLLDVAQDLAIVLALGATLGIAIFVASWSIPVAIGVMAQLGLLP